ncbi:hypothetical protein C8R43DRAFT_513145 [Mycena crocata]|nr:hypothetical protein C8R43DRAFT_513145 [Mycena crocata]
MHDSLQLRHIRRIKDQSMRLAEAVAERKLKSIFSLFLIFTQIPSSKNVLFLPALFVNLDKNLVPNPSVLDETVESGARSSAVDDIEGAMHSLTSLTFLMLSNRVPAEAAPDLWPHVWAWLNFFHTYWDALPIIKNPPQQTMAAFTHCSILLDLSRDAQTAKIIRSTPGVRRLLAIAWKTMVQKEALFMQSLGILTTVTALLVDNSDNEDVFEEIVEGVGGSIYDLASIVAQQYGRVCALPRSSKTEALLTLSGALFMFGHGAKARLDTLLQSMGVVQQVVTMMRIFLDTSGRPNDIIYPSMIYVLVILKEPPGYPNIALALKAGLLQVIVKIATSRFVRGEDSLVPGQDDKNELPMFKMIRELLTEVLPRSSVHYAVVAQLKTALPEAVKLASTWKFRKSQFAQEWRTFVKLASQRIQVYDIWVEGGPSFKACDNLTCGKIEERSTFHCCALCRSRNYCSKDCQSADWNVEHKDVCQDLQSARLHTRETLTARGRSFLRTLLTWDYLIHQAGICFEHITRRPDENFFIVFAYVRADGVGMEFASTSDDKFREEKWAPALRREVARAVRSGGRMEVHLVYIFEGDDCYPLIFPMRTPTSALHEAVQNALQQVPEGGAEWDVVKEELVPLLRKQLKSGLAVIH